MRASSRSCDEWLDARAGQFDPFMWKTPPERYARRKAFAEAAIYLYVAADHGQTHVTPRLRQLVLERTADPRFRELVLRNPRHFLLFSSPIVYAASQGELHPDLKEAVAKVLSGKTVWAAERVPHRMMDLWNFCMAYGYQCPVGTSDEFLRLGCVGLPLDSVEANIWDAYAITHHLMFCYNFGVRSAGFPNEALPYDLSEILLALTLRFVAEGNCDIVLELLMVSALHGQLPAGLARFVLGWVDARVKEHGNIPGPVADDQHRIDLDDPDFQEWYADYHTTLVAGSTMRVLDREWDRSSLQLPDTLKCASKWDSIELQQVGEALNRLHRYELPLGVSYLHEIIKSHPSTHLQGPLTSAMEFVERQRTADGLFGFFPDERTAHVLSRTDGESFDESIVVPLNEIIQGYLKSVHSD